MTGVHSCFPFYNRYITNSNEGKRQSGAHLDAGGAAAKVSRHGGPPAEIPDLFWLLAVDLLLLITPALCRNLIYYRGPPLARPTTSHAGRAQRTEGIAKWRVCLAGGECVEPRVCLYDLFSFPGGREFPDGLLDRGWKRPAVQTHILRTQTEHQEEPSPFLSKTSATPFHSVFVSRFPSGRSLSAPTEGPSGGAPFSFPLLCALSSAPCL